MAIYPDLKGKTVLITGGASGIGAALVEAFAEQGAKVGFLDRDEAAGTALADTLTAQGRQARFVPLDLRDTEKLRAGIETVRAELGPITVLVNNAAHDERHATEEVTEAYFDDRIATNFKHQFFASQAVLPDMKAAGGGAIICMSSISWMAGFGGMALYTASKSAVIGLIRSLARDFGPFNIRVNAISPGWIMTQRQLDLWLTPEADAMRQERQALKQRLMPADVAKLALFLASDDARVITSQNYIIDGGWV
ncbi:SDR family NAD(P)-dependent oxidoreductase [Phyllobacterium sp. 0TCS1.6C]|jgi:D-xylose 1-dehydrogenase|uniref:SDR family NAD(P)-dependent oxidoreductase n=1 Tax=unclassified Phyllobacterium TaxID=2638441 RepID=UPI002263F420|nr:MULTISPECIES: SDR family NAD(P)-dependent oxidoreductase [unclassified Phyllobacterium]MCX8281093.1 SDR family NAD(P)-dependent oxidoreductase [Phyllobacterium sp. 0TCS1.6C]MCX8294620.1 SDR family NAD(P)-dependent oxidoreductase [Phyllobacterium sp. 0TCS1.6A]